MMMLMLAFCRQSYATSSCQRYPHKTMRAEIPVMSKHGARLHGDSVEG